VALALRNDPKKNRRDWYSVSVDTVRALILVAVLAVLVGGALFGWKRWERQAWAREAAQLLAEGESLLRQVQEQTSPLAFRGEMDSAGAALGEARVAYEGRDFGTAVQQGRRACDQLRNILDGSNLSKSGAQAQIVSIQGEVEFRRGEAGEWQEASSRSQLRSGDYVRTSSSGSAEIRWVDGSLFTVRANTQFIVSPGAAAPTDQTIQMDYGWVDLSTRNRESQIRTPGAVARVRQSSEAFVTFDRDTGSGRFGAVRGSLQVASGGTTAEVQELQQVVQKGEVLSGPTPLPGRPEPVAPADDLAVDLHRQRTLVIAWRPPAETAHSALQVSRNRLFVGDLLVDVADRTAPRATLGLRGEGTFFWRVAAVGHDGSSGPWSIPRRFVASYGDPSVDAAD
jgi:hypothetical protein